ncbi:MAG: ribosome small subunit-dependent GTPase A [Kiritimatiellae bacterium]|nr:ribosome small subunit-dependent GTPase A [Kiritimatiellia bacterium]
MTRLERFGWRGESVPGVARIVSAHGDYYHLVCNETGGEIIARKKKSAFSKRIETVKENRGIKKVERGEIGREVLKPITGDFVKFRYNPQGESMITEILPRFSHFERKDPTAKRKSQTLAVNFDTLFVMMSLNEDFSTARIDRYLTLAEDMGEAEAVVVLTKMDLKEEGDEEFIDELVETIGGRARLLKISSLTGEGMDGVLEYAKEGRTLAFIGSSGVGKSTLLNTLAGEEWAATQEIQEWSGKGRHTTTSRELVILPSGAMIIDTPGIREIGMLGEEDDVRIKGEATHRWRK